MTSRSLCFLLCLVACGDDALPAMDVGTRSDVGPLDVGPGDSGDDAATDSATGDSGGTDSSIADGGPRLDAPMIDARSSDVSGPCQPFSTAGCEAGSWCKPEDTDVSVGMCEDRGEQELGDVCITSVDCVAGAVCSERAEGGVCDQACDPESPQGSPTNECMSGTRCANLRDEKGEPIAIGICAPSCDYDAGIPCLDSSLTCEPNELVSGAVDLCLAGVNNLPAQGDCALAGVPHGQLCGPNRICLDRMDLRPGNLCYAVCRANVGALNRAGHPDCDPEQVCTQFAVGLGVCL